MERLIHDHHLQTNNNVATGLTQALLAVITAHAANNLRNNEYISKKRLYIDLNYEGMRELFNNDRAVGQVALIDLVNNNTRLSPENLLTMGNPYLKVLYYMNAPAEFTFTNNKQHTGDDNDNIKDLDVKNVREAYERWLAMLSSYLFTGDLPKISQNIETEFNILKTIFPSIEGRSWDYILKQLGFSNVNTTALIPIEYLKAIPSWTFPRELRNRLNMNVAGYRHPMFLILRPTPVFAELDNGKRDFWGLIIQEVNDNRITVETIRKLIIDKLKSWVRKDNAFWWDFFPRQGDMTSHMIDMFGYSSLSKYCKVLIHYSYTDAYIVENTGRQKALDPSTFNNIDFVNANSVRNHRLAIVNFIRYNLPAHMPTERMLIPMGNYQGMRITTAEINKGGLEYLRAFYENQYGDEPVNPEPVPEEPEVSVHDSEVQEEEIEQDDPADAQPDNLNLGALPMQIPVQGGQPNGNPVNNQNPGGAILFPDNNPGTGAGISNNL